MSGSLGNQLIQKQQMALTPKMIEELKVLQMSNIELAQYIDEALVDNPLLEINEADALIDTLINNANEYKDNDESDEATIGQPEGDFIEFTSASITLRQYLLSQIGELKIDLMYRKLLEYMINSIDDDGYFRENINAAATYLRIPIQKVKGALKLIQKLEPAGVGARNLQECIIIQLRKKNMLSEINKCIAKDFLKQLGERRYKEIAGKLDITLEQVEEVHKIIRSLNPKPGLIYLNSATNYITPDLIVKEINGEYVTMFFDEKVPTLRINSCYRDLMKNRDCTSETNKFLKSKLSKAVEVIRAIEQRKKTVLATAEFIVRYQEDFFRKGSFYLKPLTLKLAADEIGVHESTVSRTVNNKYILTPKGVFKLKFFFSAQISTNGECSISANSIKDAIRKIVLEEDKRKPFSDDQIRKALLDKGMKAARRTVAKYREELSIFPANMRKG